MLCHEEKCAWNNDDADDGCSCVELLRAERDHWRNQFLDLSKVTAGKIDRISELEAASRPAEGLPTWRELYTSALSYVWQDAGAPEQLWEVIERCGEEADFGVSTLDAIEIEKFIKGEFVDTEAIRRDPASEEE